MARLAIVACLLVLGLPAAAEAARAGKSPADVRAYWTDARMRDARPADRGPGEHPAAKPGGGGGGQTSSTFAVNWSTAPAITTTNGKVYFTEHGINYVCSGTAVTSAASNVVFTAGHCVNDGDGAFHTNWLFRPAYNSGLATGDFAATDLWTTTEWDASGQFGRDFGAARVDRSWGSVAGSGRQLGTTYSTSPLGRRIDAFGYPAAGKYNGQRLYTCDTYLSRTDTRQSPPTMGIPCGMTGGSSGGAWVDDHAGSGTNGRLISVNSYGYSNLKNVMFGPVLDSRAASMLAVAEGSAESAPGIAG